MNITLCYFFPFSFPFSWYRRKFTAQGRMPNIEINVKYKIVMGTEWSVLFFRHSVTNIIQIENLRNSRNFKNSLICYIVIDRFQWFQFPMEIDEYDLDFSEQNSRRTTMTTGRILYFLDCQASNDNFWWLLNLINSELFLLNGSNIHPHTHIISNHIQYGSHLWGKGEVTKYLIRFIEHDCHSFAYGF